ncbi:MAG: sigma-70 family RNA polymerase sigma factor [Flavobacteriales bacterium]|nr:sigma-70 family RNA polymerase sigma factor [Flavobacteriales bacterium]
MLSKLLTPAKAGLLTEQELVQLYLEGSEKAFEILLHRHKRKVWSHIYLLVRDREIADDLFQDVFIKVVHTLKSGKYNEEGKFLPWVMRIAHEHDVFATQAQPGKNIEQQLVNVQNIEQQLVNVQIDADVRKLIDHLPEEQREVVIMRTYLNMSFKEIADLTEVSINTALGRMRYALINMRKMIKHHDLAMDRA